MTDVVSPAPAPVVARRSAKTGMSVTALVLGIVALCGSPIPILNNATIIAGFIGIVFGIIALFGQHRGMGVAGLLLSVAGVTIGLMLQAQWSAELDKVNQQLQSDLTCIQQTDTTNC